MPAAEKNKTYLAWSAAIAGYLLFILIFSALRPYGMDEFRNNYSSVKDIFAGFLSAYMTENTRIGALVNNVLLYWGKWSFLVLNPLVQLLIVFQLYGLIFLRLPDFKTLKDFLPFALIILASVFASAQPDNTIFWMNGACSYSWLMPCFLLLLILLRLHLEKNLILPNKLWIKAGIFAAAFFTGMSNENNAPMAFCIFILFGLYCLYKKIKPPFWYYWALAGIAAGLAALFGAPGLYKRLDYWVFEDFRQSSMLKKMFMHASKMNDFFKISFFIPIINILGLVLCAADGDKPAPVLKNKNFLYSFFFWGVSFTLAFVLFNAPAISLRVFYSASLLALVAFIFFIEYLREVYKFKLYKYIFAASLALVVTALPRFTVPYINLYQQNIAREAQIKHAKQQGKTFIYCQKFTVMKGPTENLEIEYYDYLNLLAIKQVQKYYGIELRETGQRNSVSPGTENI